MTRSTKSTTRRNARVRCAIYTRKSGRRAFSPHMRAKKLARAAKCLVYSLTPSGVLAENHPKNRGFVGILRGQKCLRRGQKCLERRFSRKPCRQSANLTPVPCSSTSKRSPLASTNLVCISGIQHIDLIRQYRGAGIDLLINGDRNDAETRELFASDVMPHLA